jgi:hypothetical protein
MTDWQPPTAWQPPAATAAPAATMEWRPPTAPALSGYVSAENLGRALRWVFAGWVLLLGVSAALSYETYRAVSDGVLSPGALGHIETLDDRRVMVGVVEILALLGTGVLFIAWTRRSYRNLPALGAPDLRHKPGWAVGGWLVPFVNFVAPKMIINDVWRTGGGDGWVEWRSRPVGRVVDAWWAVWLSGTVVNRIAIAMQDSESAPNEGAYFVEALATVVTLAGAILAFWVVTRTTERQQARYAQQVAAAAPAPATTDWAVAPLTESRSFHYGYADVARWLLPVAGVVAMVLGTFAFAHSDGDTDPGLAADLADENGAVWVGALTPGDCFDFAATTGADGTQELNLVDLVACDQSHEAEMFAATVNPAAEDAPYPGADVVETAAFDFCFAEFESFIGLAYEQSSLELYALWPTDASWALGDRGSACYLATMDGTPLTSSMRGAAI